MRQGITNLLARPIPATRNTRILIVDDDQLLTRWLADALAADGHEVEVASNGLDALQRLEHGAYDLILSDLRMPQMDGVEFYRRLERERPAAARQVMFLSGHGDTSEYEGFLSEVRHRSLAKPVGLPELQRFVRQGLSVQGR
jgi:CheY-like chemotaxis protein